MIVLFSRCGLLASNLSGTVARNTPIKYVRNFYVKTSSRNCETTTNSCNYVAAASKQQQVQVERSLNIAVIGLPNAGKSTFINNILNHRICPTSSKVHTTRKANSAVHTTGRTQLVFHDTPGLVTQREIKRHHLEQSYMSAYRSAVQRADVIAVLHDVSNTWSRAELHSTVLDTLKAYPALPSFLILNKIDALKSKRILLDLIRTLTNNTLSGVRQQKHGQRPRDEETASLTNENDVVDVRDLRKREMNWSHFKDVFLVSSTTGNGLHDVHSHLIDIAKERAWQYPSDVFTDATPEVLIVESVRARLLDYLPQEIPYNLHNEIEYYSVENNTIYASVRVVCATARIERLICGESNGKLRQITDRVTSDLVETFGQPISLTITTVTKHKEGS